MMPRYLLAVLVAALVVPSGTAQNRPDVPAPVRTASALGGSSVLVAGTTAGRPTFDRPQCATTLPTDPATECAPSGALTRWEEHALTVSDAAAYTFLVNTLGFDGYTYLYQGDFDPGDPTRNLVATDDGASGPGTSRIDIVLDEEDIYTFVVTGVTASEGGFYTATVSHGGVSEIQIVGRALGGDIAAVATDEGTFLRPTCTPDYPADPTAECTLGSAPVAYTSVQVVNVTEAVHQIRSTQADRDGVLLLYAGGFDPANPLDHLVAARGDDYTARSSEITYAFETSEDNPAGGEMGFYTVVMANRSSASANAQRVEFRRTVASNGTSSQLEHALFQDLYVGEVTASDPSMPLVLCDVDYPTAPATQCEVVAGFDRRYDVATITPTGEPLSVPLTQVLRFSGLLYVYRDAFDPAAPLGNLIAQNSEGTGGDGTSNLYVLLEPGVTYYLVTQAFAGFGRYVTAAHSNQNRMEITFMMPVADEAAPAAAPAFAVAPLVPNPASAGARVALTLSAGADLRLSVYDALGRRVAVLADGAVSAGTHAFTVDAAALAPGVYVVRAEAGGTVATRRLTVVR